jgi:hypothetical protein
MSRKFIEIGIGQGFRFEGASYVKTAPLMARNEATGRERFMPRSACVETEGEQMPPSVMTSGDLPAAEVKQAWRQFHARCAASLAGIASRVEPQVRRELESELASAQREFEQALRLDGEA